MHATDAARRSVVAGVQALPLTPYPGVDVFGRPTLIASKDASGEMRAVIFAERMAPAIGTTDNTLGLEPGREVHVELHDAAGAPLVGAHVSLSVLESDVWLADGGRVHAAPVGPGGLARITELVPSGEWKVSAGPGIELDDDRIQVEAALSGGQLEPQIVRLTGRRLSCLSGRVVASAAALARLRVVAASNDGTPAVRRELGLSPDGAFEFVRGGLVGERLTLGCRLANGSYWWDNRSFSFGEVGVELRPPLECSLLIKVVDERGAAVPRFGVIFGADSRTRQGSEARLGHVGFHEGGKVLLEGLSPGAHVLRVVPLDDGVPSPNALAVDLQEGRSEVVVRTGAAWELLVSVLTDQGVPVHGATVEVIAGSERVRASDINYSPVWNGVLVPDIARVEQPVRVASGEANEQGEAAFVLPSVGDPVAVRVSSSSGSFLPAFVDTVNRRVPSTTLDVIVALGATVRCTSTSTSDALGEIALRLRRRVDAPGAPREYPTQWHLARPTFNASTCTLIGVPYGEWLVDVFVDNQLRAQAVDAWLISQPNVEFDLDLSQVLSSSRAVRLRWDHEPAQMSVIEIVDADGSAAYLSVKALPIESATHKTGRVFVCGVVKPRERKGVERWYSARWFDEGSPIDAVVQPWSLSLVVPERLVGSSVEVRGPGFHDVARLRITAAGTHTLHGVCPFDPVLVVDGKNISEGAGLERAIREGLVLNL